MSARAGDTIPASAAFYDQEGAYHAGAHHTWSATLLIASIAGCSVTSFTAHKKRVPLDGRLVVWIDKETHFTLRSDQYAWGSPNQLLLRMEVTSMRYDVPLSPSLFQLSVPPSYTLVHVR